MTEYTKESGTQIRDMEEVMRDIQMETFIKGSLKWEKLMEKEDINGRKLERFMMENGLRE